MRLNYKMAIGKPKVPNNWNCRLSMSCQVDTQAHSVAPTFTRCQVCMYAVISACHDCCRWGGTMCTKYCWGAMSSWDIYCPPRDRERMWQVCHGYLPRWRTGNHHCHLLTPAVCRKCALIRRLNIEIKLKLEAILFKFGTGVPKF